MGFYVCSVLLCGYIFRLVMLSQLPHYKSANSFLMVMTGIGDYAYKRPEDGVLVVPIGCLRN